jgi:predicted metalloprotease with PDZ domain
MQAHPEYDDRYWRYVENLTAKSNGVLLKISKEDDALWRVDGVSGDLTLKYSIHLPGETGTMRAAWRPFLSPRGGLIGDLHSFMYVVGHTSASAQVTLDLPTGWKIASGLESTKDPKTVAASSVEVLLDSPIIVGQFRQWDFAIGGVPHHIVYFAQPNAASFDTAAFVDGIEKLVREAIKIAGKPPYRSYTFLYQDGAFGALEHLNSVAVGVSSQNLAQGLTGVFSTTAHEYFHTWNLMHVRPVERVGVRYRPAEPTGELWWCEGVTIYFSDLMLRRAGLPTFDPNRLARLENNLATYFSTPAYSRYSAESVSRADEDPLGLGDDTVSTHSQGNLLGTMLDLMIRYETHGQRSLDNAMQILSKRFTPNRGVRGHDIQQAIHEVCNCDTNSFFEDYVRSAGSIDFDHYLRMIGMRAQVTSSRVLDKEGKPAPDLRLFVITRNDDPALLIKLSDSASVWGRAGLHTGDRLVSLDGHSVATAADFRTWLAQVHTGNTARVKIMRAGIVSEVLVTITGYDRSTVRIVEVAEATPEQQRLRAQWLSGL